MSMKNTVINTGNYSGIGMSPVLGESIGKGAELVKRRRPEVEGAVSANENQGDLASDVTVVRVQGSSDPEMGHSTAQQLTIPGIKPRRDDAVHANRAAKQATYREKHNLQPVTIQLPRELCTRLGAYLTRTGKPKSATIADLIEKQLLRKR